jgi:hypothetical protein
MSLLFCARIFLCWSELVITSKVLRSPPWNGWPLWNICVMNDHGYVSLVVNTSRSFPRSWLITGFVIKLTRRVSLVEQQLLSLPEQLSSPPVFSGVRVTQSLVLYVCCFDRCLFFCPFSLCCLFFFDIRILITSLWYLQTLLILSTIALLHFIVNCQTVSILHK